MYMMNKIGNIVLLSPSALNASEKKKADAPKSVRRLRYCFCF